jgi:hypothetical protein
MLLGNEDGMYNTYAGMLLQGTLHKAYDAMRWSLYLKVGAHFIPALMFPDGLNF